MPQGESPFVDLGGKKHFAGQPGEIKQQRSLEHPYDLPNSYEFSMVKCWKDKMKKKIELERKIILSVLILFFLLALLSKESERA